MEHKPGTFRTSIGGQALIEGILMRGPEKQAIVVRSPEGLVTKVEELTLIKDKYPILGLPILRGAVTFLDSMIRGVKALMFSADYFPDDEAAQPSKLDLWLEKHVPAEKLQNVLVWPSGKRIAYHDVLMLHRRTDAVRDDTVVSEVTAANHIARPGGRNGDTPICKETIFIGMCDQFRAGLGVGIGVISIQLLIFTVAPRPFFIQIDLVCGHIQERPDTTAVAHTLQNVHRTHNVGLVCINRIFVAVPNNGLCRQM